MMAGPVLAIVGRANVGKSTLVNRLIGRRLAIEHHEPGVTRDARGYAVRWDGLDFTIMDTGGWEPKAKGLAAKVLAQAERAAAEADVIAMVVDIQTGLVEDDLVVARRLRRTGIPVLLVANKVDSVRQELDLGALERLGLGPPLPVSALHGRGSGDLLDVAVEHLRAVERAEHEETGSDELSVAIVGRPNVGKSSLFNRLVGNDRAIVHDLPGTTRDTVDTVVTLDEKRYRFIDTAGMRKRGRDATGPEFYGLLRSMRAIEDADVALHVIDAHAGPTEQDQRIATQIRDGGCAAVILLNKWDLLPRELVDDVVAATRRELRFVPWAPVVRTAATTARGIAKIVPALEAVRASWEQRVPTGPLNTWLREAAEGLKLGSTARARPVRIRYITQASIRPPTFVLFAGGSISTSGMRAVENRLRERFGFEGTPIKLVVRKPKRRGGTR
jgi:GTP-binding protein